MNHKFLTITEVAKKLGVSTKTIRRWEAEGKIESIRTKGGHRRFKIKEELSQKSYSTHNLVVYIVLTFVISITITYYLTSNHYSDKLKTLSDQINLLVNTNISSQNSSDTSGVAIFSPSNNNQLFIATSQIKEESDILLTPTNNQDNLYISQKLTGLGFVVSSSAPITEEVYFNWSISQ